MRTLGFRLSFFVFSLLFANALFLSTSSFAQTVGSTVTFNDAAPVPNSPTSPAFAITPAAGDPPALAGRVSDIEGTVSFHTADQDQWSYATMNYPVVSGNSFWTEPGARTEIEAGPTALRLDSGTEMNITQMDDSGVRIEVPQGTVNMRVDTVAEGQTYQVITPHETVTIQQPGDYTVHSGGTDDADDVAVLQGSAIAADGGENVVVNAGESATVPPINASPITKQPLTPTDFDTWSRARDAQEQPQEATRYVSPQMTGYQDLDRYGTWQTAPDYGAVWVPASVPADWQPYRYGHWVWVSPWGWTWVDDAPWGFAPFHYGRWAYFHDRWVWAPGTFARRPVYAPALVAFVGGNGWSLSIGLGSAPVGWFPLGPGEVYRPSYHASPGYFRNVNIANVHNMTVINTYYNHPPANAAFANRRFSTVVSQNDFAAGHPINHAALHVSADQLAHAPLASGNAPPIAEHRADIESAPAPTPPSRVMNTSFRHTYDVNRPAQPARSNAFVPQGRTSAAPTVHTGAPGPAIHPHGSFTNGANASHRPAPSAMPHAAFQPTPQQSYATPNVTQSHPTSPVPHTETPRVETPHAVPEENSYPRSQREIRQQPQPTAHIQAPAPHEERSAPQDNRGGEQHGGEQRGSEPER